MLTCVYQYQTGCSLSICNVLSVQRLLVLEWQSGLGMFQMVGLPGLDDIQMVGWYKARSKLYGGQRIVPNHRVVHGWDSFK